MGNVIRMDLYRLRKALSFKICLIIVFLLNALDGPISKIIFNIGKSFLEKSDDPEAQKSLAEMGEWSKDFYVGNLIAGQLGTICTAIFLLCIVYFCYADIQHGYIKNIAGQLPSRGHTIISKFIVIQITTFVFYAATIAGTVIGNVIIGQNLKFELFYKGDEDTPDKTFTMLQAFGEFAVKWLLLAGLCALILLLTTGIGSNVAGTIVAVLCGAGFTGLAYMGISAGINKLFKFKEDFELSDYMPDSLYRTNLNDEGCMLRALIVGIITVVVLLYFTTKLYNKKDIK